MKEYCFDMSGISNPLETMPADIHTSFWNLVSDYLVSGKVAVTKEIYDEMVHIPGPVGDVIRNNEVSMLLEVGQDGWDWAVYVKHVAELQEKYEGVISEYNGGRRNTICLNDISIIALGKALGVPVVSMEAPAIQVSNTKKRIPEVCDLEDVLHYDFSDFLRKEGIGN